MFVPRRIRSTFWTLMICTFVVVATVFYLTVPPVPSADAFQELAIETQDLAERTLAAELNARERDLTGAKASKPSSPKPLSELKPLGL